MADYQPTAEQERVLAHRADRHARLLAGPGTGKSATVVALMSRLLAADRVPHPAAYLHPRSDGRAGPEGR
jgi:hypothetical protein